MNTSLELRSLPRTTGKPVMPSRPMRPTSMGRLAISDRGKAGALFSRLGQELLASPSRPRPKDERTMSCPTPDGADVLIGCRTFSDILMEPAYVYGHFSLARSARKQNDTKNIPDRHPKKLTNGGTYACRPRATRRARRRG